MNQDETKEEHQKDMATIDSIWTELLNSGQIMNSVAITESILNKTTELVRHFLNIREKLIKEINNPNVECVNEFNGKSLTFIAMDAKAGYSRVDYFIVNLEPVAVRIGVNDSEIEIIASLLHELGHLLGSAVQTSHFRVWNEFESSVTLLVCEIEAWQIAMKLNGSICLCIGVKELQKIMEKCLKSHFGAEIEKLGQYGINIEFNGLTLLRDLVSRLINGDLMILSNNI